MSFEDLTLYIDKIAFMNPDTLTTLRQLLRKECGYIPTDETLDLFLHETETFTYDSGEILIHVGHTDSNLYVVASGIIRFVDMDGEKERTSAFGTPGTIFMSKYSFVKNMPSYYQVEACCPSVLLRIRHKRYEELVRKSHDFTLWMLNLAHEELFYQELKNSKVNNGNAKERFLAIIKNRPEIIGSVQQKIIASYLNITPEYLSRLRKSNRTILKKDK